jgi:plastocyanin
VVYLEGVDSDVTLTPETVTITMKRKAFSPHLAVIPVGGTVEFPNQDPIYHNVFSVSAPNKFDLDLYKKPESGSWTFQHPGVVKVYCNIHPQMRAVVVVRDNPWYTRAGKDGSFRLEDVPAGTHTLTAWHERANTASTEVTVSDGQTVSTSLTLDASKYKRGRHKNKHGKAYRKKDY